MKKATFIGLVILLLLVSALPVLAKNSQTNGKEKNQTADVGMVTESKQMVQNHGQGQVKETFVEKEKTFSPNPNSARNQSNKNATLPFYLQGTITAIDPAAGTITVSLIHGNAQVQMHIGSELTLTISEDVQVFQVSQGGNDEDMDEDDDNDMDDDDDRDMDDDDDRDIDEDDERDIDDDDREMDDIYESITISDNDDMDSMKEVITINQLSVGQKVAIHGIAAEDIFTATAITVYIQLESSERMDD